MSRQSMRRLIHFGSPAEIRNQQRHGTSPLPTLGKVNPVSKPACGFVQEGEGGLVPKTHLNNFSKAASVEQAEGVSEAW